MVRTFGLQTLTGIAQPVIGDVTTAAVAVPFEGQDALITVANSAIYQVGDRIVLDPLTVNSTEYIVERIPSGTTLLARSHGNAFAHASGAIIQLAPVCLDLVVLPNAGGAGPIFIGADNTITNAPAGNVIYRLEKIVAGTNGQPWHYGGGVGANILRASEVWTVGTAADTYFAYAVVL